MTKTKQSMSARPGKRPVQWAGEEAKWRRTEATIERTNEAMRVRLRGRVAEYFSDGETGGRTGEEHKRALKGRMRWEGWIDHWEGGKTCQSNVL